MKRLRKYLTWGAVLASLGYGAAVSAETPTQRIDLEDAVLTPEIGLGLKDLARKLKESGISITPDTVRVRDMTYLLGVYVSGSSGFEVYKDINGITPNKGHLPIEKGYLELPNCFDPVDGPNVSENDEITGRLREVNNRLKPNEIELVFIYLFKRDGDIVTTPEGAKVIDGIGIRPLKARTEPKRYENMRDDVMYVLTGERSNKK